MNIDDVWAKGEFAHRGIMIPGYPNMYMVMGSNSPLTNFSVIEVAEWQIGYFMQLIDLVLEDKAQTLKVDPKAANVFNEELKAAAPGTIWASGCNSYYLDQNGMPNV